MRIAVNTRFLLKNKLEGIGIYTHEIFSRVTRLLPQHEFFFLFDREYNKDFIYSKNITPVIVSPQARHPFLWYWWFEHSIPKILQENSIDLFISPDGYGSLHTEIPQLITIHDLAFEHYRNHTPWLVRKFYTHFVPRYCRNAKKILAVSEFTKQDIVSRYNIDENKIDVIYNGFDQGVTIMKQPGGEVISKYGVDDKNYFLFIGAVHPRKNVLGLLKAFEYFKSNYKHPHTLMIIGRKAWMNSELENFYQHMKYKNEVVWIEEIPREELLKLLQNAFAFVYPSLFEGFGIPIIEAMSLGVPVITSTVSSMPEVAGNSAILVDPNDTETIAKAMNELVTNDSLRLQLIEKGKTRAAQFSWDESAKKVAAIIQEQLKKNAA